MKNSTHCVSSVFTELKSLVEKRVVILDGGMGTMVLQKGLSEAEYQGNLYKDWPVSLQRNVDVLTLTQPDLVERIHYEYASEGGADILLTNTVNAQSISQSRYRLEGWVGEMNRRAVELARRAAHKATVENGRRVFVGGSLGPTVLLACYSPFMDEGVEQKVLTFDALVNAYKEQAAALLDGGVDLIAVETIVDTVALKAALVALQEVFDEGVQRVPVFVSVTVMKECMGESITTISKQTVEAFSTTLLAFAPLIFSVGLNCCCDGATPGDELLAPALKRLHNFTKGRFFVHCYPNAGIPDEEGRYPVSSDALSAALRSLAERGLAQIVGGCCGTTPAYVQQIRSAVSSLTSSCPLEVESTPEMRSISLCGLSSVITLLPLMTVRIQRLTFHGFPNDEDWNRLLSKVSLSENCNVPIFLLVHLQCKTEEEEVVRLVHRLVMEESLNSFTFIFQVDCATASHVKPTVFSETVVAALKCTQGRPIACLSLTSFHAKKDTNEMKINREELLQQARSVWRYGGVVGIDLSEDGFTESSEGKRNILLFLTYIAPVLNEECQTMMCDNPIVFFFNRMGLLYTVDAEEKIVDEEDVLIGRIAEYISQHFQCAMLLVQCSNKEEEETARQQGCHRHFKVY